MVKHAQPSSSPPISGSHWDADHLGVGPSWVNVKDYGALGNNSQDDTTYIQSAIDAAGAGGFVYFPPGTYKLTATIKFRDGQTWRGAGSGPMQPSSGFTKLNWWGSGSDSVIESIDKTSNLFNVDIEGFWISCGGSTSMIAIDFYRVSYSRISACHLSNTANGGIGIYMDANTSNQCYYNLVERVRTAMGTTGGTGYKVTGGANGNVFIDCQSQGDEIGFHVATNDTVHTLFMGCYVENNGATCFKVQGAYTKMVGCVTEMTTNGIELTSDATGFCEVATTGQSAAGVTNPYVWTSEPGPGNLAVTLGHAQILQGSGSPEGVVTARIGSLYLNTAGGTSTTLYVKTSGTGNTGWTAK
jgi:hypothetical protein